MFIPEIQSSLKDFVNSTNDSGELGTILGSNAPTRSGTFFIRLVADQKGDKYGSLLYPDSPIYYDADHSMVLDFCGIPLSVIAFYYSDWGGDHLTIKQIQGVHLDIGEEEISDNERALANIYNREVAGILRRLGNWPKSLVEITEKFGSFLGHREIMITSASEIGWLKYNDTDLAKNRYDNLAERLGYSYLPPLRNYYKYLD